MKTFHPMCRVLLVKTIRRTEIVPGVPVVKERYADPHGYDLTPFIGEGGGVHISKSTREPSGHFSITLADKAHPVFLESIAHLVEPMDMVEIRMAHAPHEYFLDGSPPVVMRGFVSTVTRSESMVGGKPNRTVTITGQDSGKILQIFQICYPNNAKFGDNILNVWKYFQKYAHAGDAIHKPAADFFSEVVQDMVNPFIASMTALSDGLIGHDYAHVARTWKPHCNVPGIISPYTLTSIIDVSLYQLMAMVLDVGPFNEMYTEDRDDGVHFIARPNPFKPAWTGMVTGDYIQAGSGDDVESITIPSADIESLTTTRSDSGTANYYWVTNDRWYFYLNRERKELAAQGPEETMFLKGYLNSAEKYYGFRKMELESSLGPPGFLNSQATTNEDMPGQTQLLADWLVDRRRILAESNRDNVIFESGTMKIRGNEKVRAGMYLDVLRGNANNYSGECYAYRVDHEFLPFRGFWTTIAFDRGTSFITRSVQKAAPYLAEIERGVQ